MPVGTNKLNDAMIQAVRAHVFSRPLGSPWTGTPTQQMQGGQGHLGGAAGRTNGYIGGTVPQSGRQTPAAAQGAQPTTGPAQGGQQPGGGIGLEHILPLLGLLLPVLLKGLGGMAGGMGGGMPTTPMGSGKI